MVVAQIVAALSVLVCHKDHINFAEFVVVQVVVELMVLPWYWYAVL